MTTIERLFYTVVVVALLVWCYGIVAVTAALWGEVWR